METRQNAIRPALDDTCKWLFQSLEYRKWESREHIAEYSGMLWLKGKPGSGKSTLMKQAVQRAEQNRPCACTIILKFYFNARGLAIERGPLDLYRSLLHQLLWKTRPFPEEILSSYREKEATRQNWEWELGELQ
jgi:protein SERAC1